MFRFVRLCWPALILGAIPAAWAAEANTTSLLQAFDQWLRLALLAGVGVLGWRVYLSRKAEQRNLALIEAERARFRALFDALPDPVWLKDVRGVVLACNPAFAALNGREVEQMLGQRLDEMLGETQRAAVDVSDQQALASSMPLRYEISLVFPGQINPRRLQVVKTRVLAPDGQPAAILGIARDISDIAETQLALRERIKEQKCLYGVFRASEALDRPLAEMFQEIVELLPAGWLYPEITVALIRWNGRNYATAQDVPVVEQMVAEIRLGQRVRGMVQVAYTEARPPRDEGPFLAEERALLDAVAERLASVLQRREAEERLRESEARFRQLFEDTQLAILLISDGRFIAANRAALQMLRIQSLDELLGRMPSEISPEYQPDGERSVRKQQRLIEQALREGSLSFEWEHLRADGEPFTVSVMLTPIEQGGRQILHVAWIDISEQKRTARELDAYRRELEQRVEARTAELEASAASLRAAYAEQQAIFDAATAGIVLVRERVIVRCNRALENLFRSPPGAMIGQTTLAWYPDAQTFAEVGEHVLKSIGEGRPFNEERELVRVDGSHFWARMWVQAVDRNDPSLGVVGIIEDISAERAASQALRQASQEQQAIFETATSGMALIKDGVLVRGNRRLHELFAWDLGSLVGQSPKVWYADLATYLETEAQIEQQIWQGATFTIEQPLMRRDGRSFWARLTGKAVDATDRSQGSVWVLDDVSAEHALIDEMARARELAEQAAMTKANFLANMSHEIRTPLNAVIGMTHLLMRSDLPERPRDFVRKIHSAGQHLLGIVNDVLDFSKIDAGKMVVEQIEFDLDKVVNDFVMQLAEPATAKGIELIVDVASDVPHRLVGDPLRLGQILLNLGSNALKFTEQGEIALRIERLEQQDDAVRLRFSVRDTGIGIEAALLPQLFQSFQQVDGSTTRKYGGTGLGLAICKRLVEMMGGEIGVHSRAGEGSQFWFTLLAGVGHSLPPLPQPEPALAGRRVLLVDDNDHAREVIAEMLSSMRFEVGSVASGEAALTELQAASLAGRPYDVALLDWQMPQMDGVATAKAIGELALESPPHRIMITAYGRDDLLPLAERAGIEDILCKPVSPSLLFDTVIRVLSSDKPRALPATEPADRDAQVKGAGANGLLECLAQVPGLDLEAGLRQLQGREALYLKTLHKFVGHYRHLADELARLLEHERWDEAGRSVHTLKGLAAQLGAPHLRSLAEQFEHALRNRQPLANLQRFASDLDATLMQLADAVEACFAAQSAALNAADANPPMAVDAAAWAKVRELGVALKQLLQAGDFMAGQLLAENQDLLRSAFGAAYQAIADAIDDFEYEQALALLEAALDAGP